ncbi:MAG TPA: hypothetical protein VGK48_02525 [Terriglobia bacterium]|jgi:hypothetical protein
MGSTFLLRRGLDEFLLCRHVVDAGPAAVRMKDRVAAINFLRSCINDPVIEHNLRLWVLADPRPTMQFEIDENLFEHIARRITTGQLAIAQVDTGLAGAPGTRGIIRGNPGQGSGKSKKSQRKSESTPREDEMARRADTRDEDEIVLNQEPEPEKTWIEIELVDPNGSPVPNERYKLTLPDGSVKWGRLDGNGKARVERLQPGSCQVTFPDRDQEVWEVS